MITDPVVWYKFEGEHERNALHDHIKAYVQHRTGLVDVFIGAKALEVDAAFEEEVHEGRYVPRSNQFISALRCVKFGVALYGFEGVCSLRS